MMPESQCSPSTLHIAGVETVETHVSTLVFDGERVHKRKKPVRFPFIDLSTRELRRQACERDVALNRRFSPDVYLGVEDVVDDAGNVVDYAVLMCRLPADRRLATLIRRASRRVSMPAHRGPDDGRLSRSCSEHRGDPLGGDPSGAARAVGRESCVSSRRSYRSQSIRRCSTTIEQLAHRYLDGRTALLGERIANGRIVDGHGDLLAEDIFCLDDGPRILDGLEFDDRLRWGDVLYDVGFLAMDLERLGRLDLATAFLKWYREFSAETHPSSLEHHYVAYRALGAFEGLVPARRPGRPCRRRDVPAMCHRHLLDARVRLVVIGGLPGSGKSTLAAALGDELGGPCSAPTKSARSLPGSIRWTRTGRLSARALLAGEDRGHLRSAQHAGEEAHGPGAQRHPGCVLLEGEPGATRAAAIAAECSADLVEVRCCFRLTSPPPASPHVPPPEATRRTPTTSSWPRWPHHLIAGPARRRSAPCSLLRRSCRSCSIASSSPADPAVPAPATPTIKDQFKRRTVTAASSWLASPV